MENFLDRTWVTQGRQDVTETTPYPIVGEYSGVIPDTDGLCAKAYSDCNNPEIMFYTIFNCFNRSEVYEGERRASSAVWPMSLLLLPELQFEMYFTGCQSFTGNKLTLTTAAKLIRTPS